MCELKCRVLDVMPERSSIDFCFATVNHISGINSLLLELLLSGIDISDALSYLHCCGVVQEACLRLRLFSPRLLSQRSEHLLPGSETRLGSSRHRIIHALSLDSGVAWQGHDPPPVSEQPRSLFLNQNSASKPKNCLWTFAKSCFRTTRLKFRTLSCFVSPGRAICICVDTRASNIYFHRLAWVWKPNQLRDFFSPAVGLTMTAIYMAGDCFGATFRCIRTWT